MRPRLVVAAAFAAFFAWLGASCRPFWAFALSHPSAFGASSVRHFLDVAALQPALVVILLLGARGLAERLLSRSLLAGLGHERPLFACGLGLGALALLILAEGSIAWTPKAALGFWAALGVLAWRSPPLPKTARGPMSGAAALAAVACGVALLAGWLQAAAPPTSWDALAYHLEVPKQWLRLGRVGFVPSVYIAKNPLLPQSLYLLAFGLGRDTLAQMMHLGFAALCCASIAVFGARRLNARAGALAAAVFASQPLFYAFAGTGNTDFTVCFFGMLSVWAFDLWAESGERRRLALAGAFAGLACASKIIGLWLALALTGLLLARLVEKRGKGAALDLAAWAGAGASAAGPWYLLNWLWLGDPVWPYFARLFNAGAPVQALFERLRASVTEGVTPTFGHLLSLPYLLLFRGEAFWYEPKYLAGPLLLAAGWLFARRRAPGLSRTVGAFCALYALLWFFVYQGWRYAILAVPWACLLTGAALDDAWRRGRAHRAAAAALLLALAAAVMAERPLSNELFALSAARPSTGESSRDRYLSLSLDHYDLFRWCNANLPPDAKVMLFGEVRPYYLERDGFLGDPLNDFRVGYAALDSPPALGARLRELGVTHVIATADASRYQGDQAYYRHAGALVRGLLGGAQALQSSHGLTLYALKPAATPNTARR
jgi:hypothetical protein